MVKELDLLDFFFSEQKLASYTVSNYSYNFQDSLSIEKLNIKKIYKQKNDYVPKKHTIFTYVDKNEVKNFYLEHDVKILEFNLSKNFTDKIINSNDVIFNFSITKMDVLLIHITFIYNYSQRLEFLDFYL